MAAATATGIRKVPDRAECRDSEMVLKGEDI